jgi:thiamine-monophosphate kinase
LVVTADLLVENIDFRLEWTTPEYLGHKSLAVSLSDVAAMGARPAWAMLTAAVPDVLWKSDFLDRFYEGWFSLARNHGVELVGGDVSRSPDKLVIDSIVGGEVAKGSAILRSGAKSGDSIFVGGSLGGAAGGLKLLEKAAEIRDTARELVLRQLKPGPQLTLANLLHSLNIVTSMIDISDGLSSDLRHICDGSGVGARIDAGMVPVDPGLAEYFPPGECLDMALNGGEDFELLFTANSKNISGVENHPLTRIGEITANIGVIELIRQGKSENLEPKGYRHF